MLIIFFEKYTPLPRGVWGIFSEQQKGTSIFLCKNKQITNTFLTFIWKEKGGRHYWLWTIVFEDNKLKADTSITPEGIESDGYFSLCKVQNRYWGLFADIQR